MRPAKSGDERVLRQAEPCPRGGASVGGTEALQVDAGVDHGGTARIGVVVPDQLACLLGGVGDEAVGCPYYLRLADDAGGRLRSVAFCEGGVLHLGHGVHGVHQRYAPALCREPADVSREPVVGVDEVVVAGLVARLRAEDARGEGAEHRGQARRGLREAVPPAVLVVEVVIGPDRLLVDDHGETVQHADRGRAPPGGSARPSRGAARRAARPRPTAGAGRHRGASARRRGRARRRRRGGRVRPAPPRRTRPPPAARGPLRPAARCRVRPRRRRPNARRRPATPGAPAGPWDRRGWRKSGEQGADGVGVGDVQAGHVEPGRERSLREQDGGGPGSGAPIDEGDGEGAQVVDQSGHDTASSPSSAYSARHHDGGRSTPNSRSTSSAAVTRRAPSSVSATGR